MEEDDDGRLADTAVMSTYLGNRFMWGYAPEKRAPIRKTKPKTEYEKLQERLAKQESRKVLKKSQKSQRIKLFDSEDNMLNMALGTDIDMQYQLSNNDDDDEMQSVPEGGAAEETSVSIGKVYD